MYFLLNWKVGVFMHSLLIVLMVIVSIIMIVAIMLQPSKTQGIGFIMGGSDTFFTKNKSRTSEARLIKITVITAILDAVIIIALGFIK
jgi:preprotein translocase subunit SecG